MLMSKKKSAFSALFFVFSPLARPNVSPARVLAVRASVFLSLPLAQPDLPPGGRYARGAATPARVVPSAATREGVFPLRVVAVRAMPVIFFEKKTVSFCSLNPFF